MVPLFTQYLPPVMVLRHNRVLESHIIREAHKWHYVSDSSHCITKAFCYLQEPYKFHLIRNIFLFMS